MSWYKDRTRHRITPPTNKKDKDPGFQPSGGKIHGLYFQVHFVHHNYRYFVQHGIQSEVDYKYATCGQLEIDPSGGDDGHDANDDDHDDDVNGDGGRGHDRGRGCGCGIAPALADEHDLGPTYHDGTADYDIGLVDHDGPIDHPTDHDILHVDCHGSGPSFDFVGGSSGSGFVGFSGGHASSLAGGPIGSGFIGSVAMVGLFLVNPVFLVLDLLVVLVVLAVWGTLLLNLLAINLSQRVCF